MFRRLFYLVLLAVFALAASFRAYFFYQHYMTWLACKDATGLCFTEGPTLIARIAPMGIPVAYAAITLVLGLLSLWSLWGVVRPARRRYT